MKRRHLMLLITLLSIIFLQNCKEPIYQLENQESYSRIFMQSASNGAIEKSLPIADEWVTFSFGAGYGGPASLDQNIQVNFEIAQDQVDIYNQQNNTNYELPPADSYRFDNLKVEIPAGKTGSNSTSVEINSVKLNGTKAYLLPVRISKVSADIPVIEELKTTYFIVKGFYETNPYEPYERTDWEVIEVSSDRAEGTPVVQGLGRHAIDGNVATAWLSNYTKVNNWRPQHPHHIVIDTDKDNEGTEMALHGVTIHGRISTTSATQNTYLFPKQIHIETSLDGTTWESAGVFTIPYPSGGEVGNEATRFPKATVFLEESKTCRYFKITVLSSHSNNGDTTAIAEIEAF
ncbi:DUF1735 domain-containing protein [Sphingobacterium sp. SGG-5]|nr:DUF1735 domain-containing protein [Sphingobacterium sp. SGG-5]